VARGPPAGQNRAVRRFRICASGICAMLDAQGRTYSLIHRSFQSGTLFLAFGAEIPV